jgi:hypothetical protein
MTPVLKPNNSSNKRMSSPSPEQQQQQPTFLSKKAHKFSSLKKKKAAAPNNTTSAASLLQKLFCSSTNIASTTGDEEGCFALACTQAVEALQLNREEIVRQTIQTNIQQAQELPPIQCDDMNCAADQTTFAHEEEREVEYEEIVAHVESNEDDSDVEMNANTAVVLPMSTPRSSLPVNAIPSYERESREQPPVDSWEEEDEDETQYTDQTHRNDYSDEQPWQDNDTNNKKQLHNDRTSPTSNPSSPRSKNSASDPPSAETMQPKKVEYFTWEQVQAQVDSAVLQTKAEMYSEQQMQERETRALISLQRETNKQIAKLLCDSPNNGDEESLSVLKRQFASKLEQLVEQTRADAEYDVKEQSQEQIAALQSEVDGLKAELTTVQSEKDALEDERDILETERDGLRYERDLIQTERDDLQLEKDHYVDHLSHERKTLSEVKAKARTDLMALEHEKQQELDNVASTLRDEIIKARYDGDNKVRIVQKEVHSWRIQYEEAQDQIEKLQGEIQAKLATKQAEYARLQTHIAEIQQQKRADLERTTESNQEFVARQEMRVTLLQRELDDKQEELTELQNKLTEAEKKVGTLEYNLAMAEKEFAHQKMAFGSSAMKSPQKARQEAAALRREMDQLKREHARQEKDLRQELKRVQMEASKLSGASTAIDQSPMRRSLLLPTKSKDATELSALQCELEQVKLDHKDTISELEKELDAVREKLYAAESELEDLKSSSPAIEQQGYILALEEQLRIAKERVATLETEVSSGAVADDSFKRDRAELQRRVNELTEEKNVFEMKQNAKLEALTVEKELIISDLKVQVERAESHVKEMHLQLARTSPMRSSKTQNAESLALVKLDLVALKREMEELSAEKDAEISKTRRQLKEVEGKLIQKDIELCAALNLAKTIHSPKHSSSNSDRRRSSSMSQSIGRSSSFLQSPSNLRDSIELHEREKEALREQIAVLEEQLYSLKSEHEKNLSEIRGANEQELAALKRDMEMRVEKHMRKERELKDTLSTVDSIDKEELMEKIDMLQAEKKAERSGGLREVQKKEELLQRICNLEKNEKEMLREQEFKLQSVREESEAEIRRLRRDIENQRNISMEKERELQQSIFSTGSFEKEDLLLKIDKLETQLESERSGTVLMKLKVASMEKEVDQVNSARTEEINRLNSSHRAERTRLESEIRGLKAELAELTAVEEAMQITTNEKEQLQDDIIQLRREIDLLRSGINDQVAQLQSSAQRLQFEHAEKIKDLAKEHSDQMERVRAEAVEELEKREAELTQQWEQKVGNSEKDLRDEITILRVDARETKRLAEEKVKKLQAAHAKESEDLLAQLDLVEAEHKEKLTQLSELVAQKDAAIAALGRSLVEASAQEKATDNTTRELERTKDALTKAHTELRCIQMEFDALQKSHATYVKEAETTKEKACEEAREEMVRRAEEQFKQANGLYVKLKKQYDISKKKVESLERETRRASGRKTDKTDSSEVDLRSEIAQLQASKAKIEADAARKAKEYRREMERLLKGAEGFEKKLRESESATRHVSKKLAVVVSEKSKLQKEHDEIKNVCEELMSMVEGQQQHEC